MSLWANTADGWGSDPSSSGNGALATYLQSSAASAPKSQSLSQVQDPSTSTPTTSIARTVQPATTQTAVIAPVTQSKVLANIATPSTTFVAPTAVTNPSTGYTGATTLKQGVNTPGQSSNTAGNLSQYAYYIVDPTTGNTNVYYRTITGTGGLFGSGYSYKYTDANGNAVTDPTILAKMNNDAGATTVGGTATGSAATDLQNASNTFNSQAATYATTYAANAAATQKTNQANLTTAQNTAAEQGYLDYLYAHNGQQAPPLAANSLDAANDATLRAQALATYQANQQSAATISQGVTPVDTSTQDAQNRASLAALTSRFSTNLMGNNISAMGQAYASAIADQTGVNQQLSDEDYANRFNQNLSQFASAVQNQSTLDVNATGTKLQSDIQAVSDTVANLNQQVQQLGTQSGQAVSNQLTALQGQIDQYQQARQQFGASSSEAMGWAKIVLGAVAGVSSLALAPVTGGASLAAGTAATTAIAGS